MSRHLLLATALAATLASAGVLLAADIPGMPGMTMPPATAPSTQPATQPGAVDLANTVCPVSGDPVGSSKLTAVYDGKIYHFCCSDCPPEFAKNPAKYAALVAADPAKYGVKK